VLAIDHLTVRYGTAAAVDDVSLLLPTGDVLAVLGPSGSGKSTLLRAVAGLARPDAGSISFDDADLTRVPAHRRGFALMFQDGQLFAHLSVAENVGYPLRLRREPRSRRARRVDELLALVGLGGYGDRAPATLSGGERQRVALARALAVRPRLLLLDEPLSALDRHLRERLASELRDILKAAGTTALLVTHDHDEAFAVADRMAVMRDGRIVQDGTLDAVWRHPVDGTTARFLGYATVVPPATAALLLAAAPAGPADWSPVGSGPDAPLALRRSALRVDPSGRLTGRVTWARVTPEETRLVVEVAGVGVLDAVAGADVPVRAGEQVRLALDPARTAVVGPGPDASPS
jgi:thiamine transport system ATP-binding protein